MTESQENRSSQEQQTTPPDGPMSVSDMVNRLEELVLYALECEHKELREGVSFVEVYRQLTEIRKSLEFLSEDQQKFLAFLGTVEERRSGVATGPADFESHLSENDKKTIEKLNRLKTLCEQAKERAHTSILSQPEAVESIKEKLASSTSSEKKKVIHRRGKFRQMGGDQGWVRT